MARSPWRDALDGQIAVLRCLRGDVGAYHLAAVAESNTLIKLIPNRIQRAQIQDQCGVALSQAFADLVAKAEPVYLTHDILNEIKRRSPGQTDLVLTRDMLPIPAGLIWFGQQGINFEAPTDLEPHDQRTVRVRALYFGPDARLLLRQSITGPKLSGAEILNDEMGGLLFLDSTESGYVYADQIFRPHHLVPVGLGGWKYGSPLLDNVTDTYDRFNDNPTWNQGTLVLMSLSFSLLYTLFTLMLQRVTLWGGVGLNRQEQKDAEREHLRPRVQLVTWRKAHYKYPEGHIPVPVSWSCRWSVREHYRRYKSGKTVKIQSYVKGPPDKPFVLPVDRANIVKR